MLCAHCNCHASVQACIRSSFAESDDMQIMHQRVLFMGSARGPLWAAWCCTLSPKSQSQDYLQLFFRTIEYGSHWKDTSWSPAATGVTPSPPAGTRPPAAVRPPGRSGPTQTGARPAATPPASSANPLTPRTSAGGLKSAGAAGSAVRPAMPAKLSPAPAAAGAGSTPRPSPQACTLSAC